MGKPARWKRERRARRIRAGVRDQWSANWRRDVEAAEQATSPTAKDRNDISDPTGTTDVRDWLMFILFQIFVACIVVMFFHAAFC